VQGWRRRHRELGHVALALAHVSRLKLEPNAFRLGRLSVTCVDRVQPDSLHNLGGVRVGLGHRFAAAWVRVRAALNDGRSCVICETTPTGCPRSRPRVSPSIYLSIYLSGEWDEFF
jgi:hypothetical protein